MKTLVLLALITTSVLAGPFAPSAGISGSTAISKNSAAIVGWATGYLDYMPGPQDITDPTGPIVTWPYMEGDPNPAPYAALGPADAESDSLPVVSLGDGGSLTLTFAQHIHDGNGFDFAVFENGITDTFLELAFVEVSSDGLNYTRFHATSATPTTTQVGSFGALNATNLNNLAGKYRRGFGTPFDLAELIGTPGLNLEDIGYVRIVDVVGSINPLYATRDSLGNIINDPWKTPYETGGFDLDAIAVLNAVPEPASAALLLCGAGLLARRRRYCV